MGIGIKISLKDGIILGETRESKKQVLDKIKAKAEAGINSQVSSITQQIVDQVTEEFGESSAYDQLVNEFCRTVVKPAVKEQLWAKRDVIAKKIVDHVMRNLEFDI